MQSPGKFPYIPDRDYLYYVNLAGGFDPEKNVNQKVTINDMHGLRKNKGDPILPEYTIIAENNSFTYYFTKYAPIFTTMLSLVTTFVSVQALVSN